MPPASSARVRPEYRSSAAAPEGAAHQRPLEFLRIGREDQILDILRRIRQRHQLRAGRARRGLHRADLDRQRPARKRRSESDEIAALQVAEHLGLAPVHAEQVGSARHVDIEKGAAHQEVRGLGGDVLCELGKPLRRDHAGKTAFTAAAHQIGHRAERHLARIFRDIAADRRRKHLRLVDHDENRIPVFAIGIEHAVEEGGGGAHLVFEIEVSSVSTQETRC